MLKCQFCNHVFHVGYCPELYKRNKWKYFIKCSCNIKIIDPQRKKTGSILCDRCGDMVDEVFPFPFLYRQNDKYLQKYGCIDCLEFDERLQLARKHH
jgi:hypothetical protein